MHTTSWEQIRDEDLATMTPAERAEYDAAGIEADARMDLAELVYWARRDAGLTQAELAERIGTRQGVISAIENGRQAPGGIMLARMARALGGTLRLTADYPARSAGHTSAARRRTSEQLDLGGAQDTGVKMP